MRDLHFLDKKNSLVVHMVISMRTLLLKLALFCCDQYNALELSLFDIVCGKLHGPAKNVVALASTRELKYDGNDSLCGIFLVCCVLACLSVCLYFYCLFTIWDPPKCAVAPKMRRRCARISNPIKAAGPV